MKRKLLVLLAILAVTCWAGGAWADTFTLTSGSPTQTILNPGGVPGSAVFTLVSPTQLSITLNYTGSTATETTLLTALFWTSSTFATQVSGQYGSATGPTASVIGNPPVFTTTGPINVSGFWAYGTGPTTLGNQGVLAAGLGYNFTPLNGGDPNNIDGPGYSIIPGGTSSLTGNLINHQPYMFGTVTVLLNIPSTTSYVFSDPNFYLGTAAVPKVPIPPTALLMGTGLLGIIGLGWRRRK